MGILTEHDRNHIPFVQNKSHYTLIHSKHCKNGLALFHFSMFYLQIAAKIENDGML